jgi:hypothetical protein
LQTEKPLPEIDPTDTEQINAEEPELQDKEDMEVQNTQHEEEEKDETSEQSIPTTQQTVTKDDQTPKSADKRKKRKSSIITIRTTGTMTPSGSSVETSFDPTTISDKHLFDLHGAISKESTRRWKKVLKEGSRVERLKQEKNNILEGCREAVRMNEGIEQMSEVQNPLEGFKELIDRMIKTTQITDNKYRH